MKHIITCICFMLASGLMAQSTPTSSSEARKINMSRTNGKAALQNSSKVMTDSPAAVLSTSDIGVRTKEVDKGLLILGFPAGNSSAKAAKLKVGDIITSINTKPMANIEDFNNTIASYEPGDVVSIGYTRGDRALTKDVRINGK